MGFMRPVVEFGQWYRIDGTDGTEYVPADIVGCLDLIQDEEVTEDDLGAKRWKGIVRELRDYVTGDIYSVELIEGFGAGLAPQATWIARNGAYSTRNAKRPNTLTKCTPKRDRPRAAGPLLQAAGRRFLTGPRNVTQA